ncbi:MAG: TonB-dependent receptor [Nitrospinae bacterium]|nr:TonB-dependent receptor [Nitrospinota bacterium]
MRIFKILVFTAILFSLSSVAMAEEKEVIEQQEVATPEKKEEKTKEPSEVKSPEGEKGEVLKIDEVVVTATRTEKEVSEAPASVSVVDSKEIETKNIHRANEALSDIVGAYVTGGSLRAPSSGDNVVLRGLPFANRSLILIDDHPLNDGYVGTVNFSSIPPEDIDRIEVVRGPFSSLYGGSAMGGVINIITKVPDKREFIFKGGYGTDALKSGSFAYRDRLLDNRLGLSFIYGYQETDGYIDDYVVKTASSGTGTTSVTGWRRTTTNLGAPAYLLGDKGPKAWGLDNTVLKLFYDITPSSKLSLGFFYVRNKAVYDYFKGFNTYLRDRDGNPVTSGSISFDDNGSKKITLSEYEFLPTPFGEETKRYTASYNTKFGSNAALKAEFGFMDKGRWDVIHYSTATEDGGAGRLVDMPINRLDGTVHISFPVLDRHFLVMGVSTDIGGLNNKRDYTLNNWKDKAAKGAVTYHVEGKTNIYAFFLQDEIYLSEDLTAYLGGRYDYWETEGMAEQFISPTFHNDYSKRDKSAFSPKASLVYTPWDKTTMRTSVGTAFRTPTIYELYAKSVSSSGVTLDSNPDLKPETMTSWEIGIEQGFQSGTTFRATYYENYLSDLIYSSYTTPMLSEKHNAGKAETKGIELEVRQQIFTGLTGFANYTYNNSKITENSASPKTVGKQMVYTVPELFNIGVDIERGAWSGSVIGRYIGNAYGNDQNLDTVDGVWGAYDSYFTLNAKIGYQIKEWISASFSVDNILDKEYYQYRKMPGRNYFGELTLKF